MSELTELPPLVRVRCETPMLELAWGEVVELSRTPLVEAAIATGRLTDLDQQQQEERGGSDVSAVQGADGDEPADGAAASAGESSAGGSAAEVTWFHEGGPFAPSRA